MKQNSKHPVLIAGGGVGGLSAALALARNGLESSVFEQADEFKEIGAGIQLGPNAFHTFDDLGIADEVHELTVYPDDIVAMDAINGEEIVRLPVAKLFPKRFGKPYGLIHRADLHSVLLRACRETGKVNLLSAKKVTDFNANGKEVVVTAADEQQHTGAALIGADGLWSTVRQRIVGDGKPRISGHIAYRAVLPLDQVPEANRQNAMVVWMGPRFHLVHYPLRGHDMFNLVAVFHSDRFDEGWDSYGDPEELNLRFKGARPEVLGMLEKIDSWRMWVLCDREPIANWTKGNTTLLGDAAHPMLQYLAQGACMAMEDAVCLSKHLTLTGNDFDAAFSSYQKARYLRTARIQQTARLYGQAYHAADATRDLRNHFLKSRTPEQTMESMAWMYDKDQIPV
ncbi:3-hydroxybenzoate 6-monooxygenase [Advenella mimigardefordensis]|uniref:Putative 3-hydroxybenzoate 6-hydroxylase n=1 Tax=Advenella mimigardefordensis (strain DSM 17166 / LMG 22922 / DPN7) TaxID=1247726 RepID=W0PMF3_ADVMD|nr:3-hydroxybenzoate 6-monooxygenase [Advenella mimigardefordensis]AHG66178.1 putative 3-hydroxybenzoate 6-hydroxylase [Advenella mimigardefordensis DPN7]